MVRTSEGQRSHDGGGFEGKGVPAGKVLRAESGEGKGIAGNAATAIPRSPDRKVRGFRFHDSGLPRNEGGQGTGGNYGSAANADGPQTPGCDVAVDRALGKACRLHRLPDAVTDFWGVVHFFGPTLRWRCAFASWWTN